VLRLISRGNVIWVVLPEEQARAIAAIAALTCALRQLLGLLLMLLLQPLGLVSVQLLLVFFFLLLLKLVALLLLLPCQLLLLLLIILLNLRGALLERSGVIDCRQSLG